MERWEDGERKGCGGDERKRVKGLGLNSSPRQGDYDTRGSRDLICRPILDRSIAQRRCDMRIPSRRGTPWLHYCDTWFYRKAAHTPDLENKSDDKRLWGNNEPKLRGNVGNGDVGHMTYCFG